MQRRSQFGNSIASGAERLPANRSTLRDAFIFPVLPVAIGVLLLIVPGVSRAQQWPPSGAPSSGFPQNGSPQDSRDVPSGLTARDSGDPMAAMETAEGMLPLMPIDNSRLINDESCQTWTAAAVNSPTVSVARLEVPGKASHEFQKACGDFKDRRLRSAEEHARKAVKIDSDYAAAWVLLGQILHENHKDQDAIEACRTASRTDPDYAPPYICLSGFAARASDWDEAYSLANHALSLDPATDPYAFLYTATADYHLKRMAQAELYALSAEKLDKWNHIPEVHLLLAELYHDKGDRAGEAAELRKFVKMAPHGSDWETARATLAAIESQSPAK
jgi:tetratricopeptide (TPR) repeat protein